MKKPLKKRNFRDLSYLVTEDGYRLKEGLFFRSGSLYRLSKKERKAVEGLHIDTVLDLRTDGEVAKKPDDAIPGIEEVHNPIVKQEMLGITHEKGLKGYKAPPDMPWLYRQIVSSDYGIVALGNALKRLFSLQEGPRLWHCTAGKDRAGIVSALFLLALGYKEEDIIADYELSDKPNRKKGRLYRNLILFLLWKKKLAIGVYKAMRADRQYLLSAFKGMAEVAGSVQEYIVKKLGITEELLADFKAKYMVKA